MQEHIKHPSEAVAESAEDIIISLTLDGVIVSWTTKAEMLYGYTTEDIRGRHISMLFPQEYINDIPKILIPAYRGQPIKNFETITTTKAGTILQISITTSPVKDDSGEIIKTTIIIRDITERKHRERDSGKTARPSF